MISADTAAENTSWLRGPIGGNGYRIGDLAAKVAMEYLTRIVPLHNSAIEELLKQKNHIQDPVAPNTLPCKPSIEENPYNGAASCILLQYPAPQRTESTTS